MKKKFFYTCSGIPGTVAGSFPCPGNWKNPGNQKPYFKPFRYINSNFILTSNFIQTSRAPHLWDDRVKYFSRNGSRIGRVSRNVDEPTDRGSHLVFIGNVKRVCRVLVSIYSSAMEEIWGVHLPVDICRRCRIAMLH